MPLGLRALYSDWHHLVEVLVLWLICYAVLRSLRGTRLSGLLRGLFVGIVVFVLGIQLLAQSLGLVQLQRMIDLLLGGLALSMLVIFAPDMHRAIARFAGTPLLGPLFGGRPSKAVATVADAVMRLAQNRVGALIVFEREIGLRDIVERGVTLDAEVTAPLIESIFFPGSALHDGALVIRRERAVAAACFLPLSESPDVARNLGTRHRAALGITEESDAVAVVVSEETGKVTCCVDGRMARDLDRESLIEQLTGAMRPLTRRKEVTPAVEVSKDPEGSGPT